MVAEKCENAEGFYGIYVLRMLKKSKNFSIIILRKKRIADTLGVARKGPGFPHMLLLIGLVIYLDIGFLIYRSLVKKRIVGDSWTGYLVFLLWPFVAIIWGLELIDRLLTRKG